MDYAVIDLGSNSIRLSVYNCENDQIHKTFSEKDVAGLAGYVAKGVLHGDGIQKACEVINHFKDSASRFVEPANVRLFATASLRNIKNRDEAAKTIAEQTLLTPDILEGDEEAALGFAGVARFMDCDNGIMIDIGGGSTEFVHFRDKQVVNLISLPIGCLNVSVKCVKKIVPSENERKQIKALIKERFDGIDWAGTERYPLLVGSGGTMRAVLKLSRALFDLPAQENGVQASHVQTIDKLLRNNKDHIYSTVYKAIPDRMLTISTGLAILRQAIKTFGSETIKISQYGIREGYLLDRVLKPDEES
jgi:exopolyphosphatase/guanosine-5'-triphosphate,3'-diphosphate pyrophosphatase